MGGGAVTGCQAGQVTGGGIVTFSSAFSLAVYGAIAAFITGAIAALIVAVMLFKSSGPDVVVGRGGGW